MPKLIFTIKYKQNNNICIKIQHDLVVAKVYTCVCSQKTLLPDSQVVLRSPDNHYLRVK